MGQLSVNGKGQGQVRAKPSPQATLSGHILDGCGRTFHIVLNRH